MTNKQAAKFIEWGATVGFALIFFFSLLGIAFCFESAEIPAAPKISPQSSHVVEMSRSIQDMDAITIKWDRGTKRVSILNTKGDVVGFFEVGEIERDGRIIWVQLSNAKGELND